MQSRYVRGAIVFLATKTENNCGILPFDTMSRLTAWAEGVCGDGACQRLVAACSSAQSSLRAHRQRSPDQIGSTASVSKLSATFSVAVVGPDLARRTCNLRQRQFARHWRPRSRTRSMFRPNPRPPVPGHASGAAKGSKCCARRLIQTCAGTDDGRPKPGA